MTEQTHAQAISTASRNVIERPRLTRLLDNTPARVIMLVAPPGYGKTTLARQWLACRPHVWFEANDASSDVVGLATDLADVLEATVDNASLAVTRRARLTTLARDDVAVLAGLQAKAIHPWPASMWLAIDDYELLTRSDLAEEYIHLLQKLSNLRLLLTSRVRPRWAKAKALLYGDICAIDARDLAMREEEARLVLHGTSAQRAHDISAFDGWPAVVGLASLTDVPCSLSNGFSRPLFQFFAEELFQRASTALRAALPQLALAPWPEPELAAVLVGPRRAPRILAEAMELGFFSPTTDHSKLHPLLRRFLLDKLDETPAIRDACTNKVLEFLLSRREWDAAFEVIAYAGRPDGLVRLCDEGYSEMLALGRAETLMSWLEAAVELGATSNVFALIRAELALREGNHLHARRLAEPIARDAGEAFRARALQVAGRAAHLDEDEAESVRCFETAVAAARNADERRDALGCLALMAQSRESLDDVTKTLKDFLSHEPRSADDVLRVANVRFASAITVGDVAGVLAFARDAAIALEHARDPAVRTSFLNAFSRCLSMQVRYQEALEIAERLLREAETARLEFVLPHAHVGTAVALAGLCRYADAEAEMDVAQRAAAKVHDLHNLLEARTVRAKVALARGRYEKALTLTAEDDLTRSVTRIMRAEVIATRGLAQACSGSLQDAAQTLQCARQATSVPEVSALVAAGRAVIELANDDLEASMAELAPAISVGVLEPIVLACRAHPALGRLVTDHADMPAHLVSALQSISTGSDKDTVGIRPLTAREEQVLELLSRGRTNAEIAEELVIAEVTAKAHVRNIIHKLGVRSRTEAAIAVLQHRF